MVTDLVSKGASYNEIAKKLGISITTFYDLKRNPIFYEYIEKGKAILEAQLEGALFKSAIGYNVIERKTTTDEDHVVVVESEKHIPGNATSLIFALKNTMPNKYKDRVETVHDINITLNNLSKLTDDELAKYVEIPTDYEIE